MIRARRQRLTGLSLVVLAIAMLLTPARVARTAPAPREAVAYFAGGCFWGTEAVYEHVRGVLSVTSGYSRYNSTPELSPSPIAVESVRITYDPSQVSYHSLLDVFFAIAHDPTTRDRQGPDIGPEYRAVVLVQNADERREAETFMAALTARRTFSRPIVTEVRPLASFVVAEALHQDYAARHPDDPYIRLNDQPKLIRLKERFSELYQAARAR
jgi:peptide-methionine (S)-S-oxide reductase